VSEDTPAEHIRRLKPPTPRTILLIVAALVVLFLLYLARDGLLIKREVRNGNAVGCFCHHSSTANVSEEGVD
jgi:hypothetical protein